MEAKRKESPQIHRSKWSKCKGLLGEGQVQVAHEGYCSEFLVSDSIYSTRHNSLVLQSQDPPGVSGVSACRRNTFPRITRQSMRSKVGMRSRLITPATKLWEEEPDWERFHATGWEESEEQGGERRQTGGWALLCQNNCRSDSWTQRADRNDLGTGTQGTQQHLATGSEERGILEASECPA